MKHEESLKLMELMIQMGFEPILIMRTLDYCSRGNSIGSAFMNAVTDHMGESKDSNELQ